MMVFVDGENITLRYEAMLKKGKKGRPEMRHKEGVYVWFSAFTHLARDHEVLRVSYYTTVVGDSDVIDAVRSEIKGFSFDTYNDPRLPQGPIRNLTPVVFKKSGDREKSDKNRESQGLPRSRIVDIQLTVDVLHHVYCNHIDTVYLVTGDGDFAILIREIQRAGKLVYVAGFTDGFSPKLSEVADQLYHLDGTTFTD